MVSLLISTDRYSGLSTDNKPNNVVPGTKFFEIDTCENFVYVLGAGWVNQKIFNQTVSITGIENCILNGDVYNSSRIYDPLPFGETIITRLLMPSNKFVNFKSVQIGVEGASIEIILYKNVTILNNNGGLEVTNIFQNLNDNSSKISTVRGFIKTLVNPIEFIGTVQKTFALYGHTTNQAISSDQRLEIAGSELINKPNENYILYIRNFDQNEQTAYHINIVTTLIESTVGGLV